MRKCFKQILIDYNINFLSSPKILLGLLPCNKCSFCKFCLVGSTFKIYGKTTHVLGCFTCNSSNLVYCIQCQKCNLHYIGETKLLLKQRLSKHLSDIRISSRTSTIANHFRTNHNLIEDLRIFVLKSNVNWSDKDRKINEMLLIKKFKTKFPNGLNDKYYTLNPKRVIFPYLGRIRSNTLNCLTQNFQNVYTYNPNIGRLFHSQKFN